MSDATFEPLSASAGSQLVAVTFVKDYLQLALEGPQASHSHHLNVYNPSRVQAGDTSFRWGEVGYRDALCTCIDAHVSRAASEAEQIVLEFNTGTIFAISLRKEDFDGPEAGEWAHNADGMVQQHMIWQE
ncbi:MAG TPA: hypothetical protein VGF38_12545 [Ktedonobacterales bacterium]|jgi:hypothetical protein